MLSRFKQLLENLDVNASEFASRLGIQRSSVSHVLSGRNKPSIDFLEKLLNAYPNINAAWLITGHGHWEVIHHEQGDITTREEPAEEERLSDQASLQPPADQVNEGPGEPTDRKIKRPTYHEDKPVDHIIIVYQDDTFRILNP